MSTTLLPNTPSTIGSWARFIAQGLDACGVDSHQLFLDADIDLAESENPNVRFPVHKMSRVWQLAVQRTGDPGFALTLASHANPSMYNALGMSMVSSRTLASALAMSTRSLQRSLQKEGVSFKELLEMTRQDMALKYIEEKQLSIIEICCLLGFSDQSNFTKAFKRWTGKTPYSYRQALAAQA